MTSNSLALLNQLRPMSVGFNDIFERFEAMLGNNPASQSWVHSQLSPLQHLAGRRG